MISVVVIITSIIYLSPVDPARLTFGQRSDAGALEAKRSELGLDQPLYVQLGKYLNDLSPISCYQQGSSYLAEYSYVTIRETEQSVWVLKKPFLRESYQSGRPVAEILFAAIPQTIILALVAILIATIIGVCLGTLAAIKHNTWWDHFAVIFSVFGISVPSYVAAMFFALLFGYWLAAYTGLNLQGSLVELDDFGDEQLVWKNIWLPALALGVRPVAIITQLTRSAMLDVLSQDYIRTARAKGLSKLRIWFRHALRNAANPVITAVSGWLAALLAGAFFVENVFNYQGLGKVTVDALLSFDIPVVLGGILFTTLVFILINILVDIIYALLDPRVSN